jgi:hypothetical protein
MSAYVSIRQHTSSLYLERVAPDARYQRQQLAVSCSGLEVTEEAEVRVCAVL